MMTCKEGKPINNKSQYLEEDNFKVESKEKTKIKRAIKFAMDTRKFEIELYWKRAHYFWLYNVSAFTAYFYIISSNHIAMKNVLSLLVTGIGVFLSLCWVFINKASKYWQENWEKHVDILEDYYMIPLYKTTIEYNKKCFDWICPLRPYKYSVSNINNLLSFGIFLVWLLLWINCILTVFQCLSVNEIYKAFIVLCITVLLLISLKFCRTKKASEKPVMMQRIKIDDENKSAQATDDV